MSSDREQETRREFKAAVVRIVESEFGLLSAQSPAEFVGGLPGPGSRSRVDVLGELVDRLPDALSVAEVVVVLDRFDVALRGHCSSPSIGAADVAPSTVSDPIVGEASGAGVVPPTAASDAPFENSRSADRVPAGVSGEAGRGTVGTDAPTTLKHNKLRDTIAQEIDATHPNALSALDRRDGVGSGR